ncbi:MAG: DsrE family protein [Gemmatimonadota bacterium]
MSRSILVHITHGPEHPTRAALGFAVARAAQEAGHSVTMFLAGDAVQLVRSGVVDHLHGLGTGSLGELLPAVMAGGAKLYLSGGSSGARGVTQADLNGIRVELAGPAELVRLALEHDRMFTY